MEISTQQNKKQISLKNAKSQHSNKVNLHKTMTILTDTLTSVPLVGSLRFLDEFCTFPLGSVFLWYPGGILLWRPSAESENDQLGKTFHEKIVFKYLNNFKETQEH